MKITKRILKQIIKEELQNLKEGEMSQIVADETGEEEPHEEEPHEDDMTHGEYFAKGMGLPWGNDTADVLDEFSVAISAARKRRVSPMDIRAFVEQVLGPAQSDEIIDV